LAGFVFLKATTDEIDQYVMGKLVWQSQELSSILIGHLMIEGLLDALIAKSLPKPDRLIATRNLTFDLKVELANSLGILPDQHFAAAKALNKIRNHYSHNPDYEISLDELSPFRFGWEDIQREAFDVAASKGVADAVQISMIFLSFAFQALLRSKA
jgi:hypothetical protein